TCVHPWCTRRARRADCDHVIPHRPADGSGSTCSCNIAPLCRRHPRQKTHTAWTYTLLDPTTFLWRSPNGLHLLVAHTGTRLIDPQPPPGRRAEPAPAHPPDG